MKNEGDRPALYMVESLTPMNSDLLYKAKQKAKTDDSKYIAIKSESDLNKIR